MNISVTDCNAHSSYDAIAPTEFVVTWEQANFPRSSKTRLWLWFKIRRDFRSFSYERKNRGNSVSQWTGLAERSLPEMAITYPQSCE